MKHLYLILFYFISNVMFGQNDLCGFKKDCTCARTSTAESFQTSDYIIRGLVINIDTVSVESLLQKEWVERLRSDQNPNALCAKQSLQTARVLQVEIQIQEVYKYRPNVVQEVRNILICTPLDIQNCGYQEFRIGEGYLVYGTSNQTADIYFHWTFDQDFFYLKTLNAYWTNHCNRTKKADRKEIRALKRLSRRAQKLSGAQ